MRLLLAASESAVTRAICAAMRLKARTDVVGSTDEIMMASAPAATRSFMRTF